ncbi:hypothetical protein [Cellulomonas fengjieae]|uniref:hypothetical protein n=1 Tax=Cellulomonas fengjieae TaxID=2819978 RepID=UPI001AAEB3CE|nr:hypothetical protein [Cellulomonas fengjieae]MBO3100601.1 hypothetical protein [Cellulomonas fengjieae]
MSARHPSPSAPSTARRWTARIALQALGLVVGVALGLFFAVMIRDYAMLWMVLLPIALWALANRSGVRSAAGGFDLARVPTGDLVAMALGVLLAVPATLTVLDGSWWRTAALVVVLGVLGFGMLGYAGAIRDGATLHLADGADSPRVVRAADVALRGLRSSSGLANMYLAAVGTLLAFPDGSNWVPTLAVVLTGGLHAVLDGREPRTDVPVQASPGRAGPGSPVEAGSPGGRSAVGAGPR